MELSKYTAPLLRNKWTRIPAGIVLWPIAVLFGILVLNRSIDGMSKRCEKCGRLPVEHGDDEYGYVKGVVTIHSCKYVEPLY